MFGNEDKINYTDRREKRARRTHVVGQPRQGRILCHLQTCANRISLKVSLVGIAVRWLSRLHHIFVTRVYLQIPELNALKKHHTVRVGNPPRLEFGTFVSEPQPTTIDATCAHNYNKFRRINAKIFLGLHYLNTLGIIFKDNIEITCLSPYFLIKIR